MDDKKTYLRLMFDLDNTLTRSRSKIEPEMKELLSKLTQDIVVTSGAAVEQMRFQLDGLPCYILAQNGNHAVHGDEELWHDTLSLDEVAEVNAHIASLKRSWDVPDESDLIENRGSQISYSIYGHHAPVPDKEKFDPDQAKRITMLKEHPLISDTIDIKIAGTTCFDYFKKGRNKGFNIARLCEYKDWNLDTCLYFGDCLFDGGNDETVIGIVDTESVSDPQDTYRKLTVITKGGIVSSETNLPEVK